MKIRFYSFLAFAGVVAVLFGCGVAHADTNAVAAVADVTPYAGADTTGAIVAPFISGLVVKFPWIMTILAVMGTARAVAKPLFSAIEAGLGPDNAFAKKLAAAESGPIYKSLSWLLDFFFSIKSHLLVKSPTT
jgi:hypothetical protein